MARFCELTGKKTLSGNNVSHSNRKTRRKFFPNIVTVKLHSEILRKTMKFDLAARTLKTINFKGGLDEYLVKAKAHNLTEYGQKLRRQVKKSIEKVA